MEMLPATAERSTGSLLAKGESDQECFQVITDCARNQGCILLILQPAKHFDG